ncbi:MAG: hypothetical protein NT107_05655 [Planctomycetota bacterium]|nr:hypothetical protein [Planctomycetota bacterium]
MNTPIRLLAALLALVFWLPAQADFKAREAELSRSAASALSAFANNARTLRMLTRTKQSYDLILANYEPDNQAVRMALGFKKNKDKWEQVPEDKRPKWTDKANNDQRYKVVDEWVRTARKLGDLHRVLGLEIQKAGGDPARCQFHLERAVYYYPFDKEAHLALQHKESGGFFGTEQEITFVKNMRAIELVALELAKKEYRTQAIAQTELPPELKNVQLEFSGAKSEHFTIWTRGTQENADNCVKWSERGLDFLIHLVGEKEAKRRQVVQKASPFKWLGFVWTDIERTDFLSKNPQIMQGKTIEEKKHFANVVFESGGGQAMVLMKLTPAQMHDTLITWVFKNGFTEGLNDALAEGLQHAATWYLMSTSISQFGALPEGTVAGKELKLPESTNWWLRHIRDQAIASTDFPIGVVPREKLSSFRNDVRVKSWSFMTWLLARYPDKWVQFFTKVPAGSKKVILSEDVEKVGEDAFGCKLAEVDADWREWARGGSGVAAATGYGPPLLPEKPNKQEIAVLERMNQCRALALAYSVTGKDFVTTGKKGDKDKGKGDKDAKPDEDKVRDLREGQMGPLPLCELDAEASLACEAHASYLTKWPEQHMKWPEAHEENPALEGFSPRGMRAGMRSVIVFANGDRGPEFAKESVDGWIGTVYHRFPLLEHNINRFGYSYVFDNGWSVAVLDMGSLEEPYDPALAPKFVAWPPPLMKDVPLRFHGNEMPNPLDDQPENERDLKHVGYPVSLQLQKEFAAQVGECDIGMFEVRQGGKVPARNLFADGNDGRDVNDVKAYRDRRKEPVPIYKHTPQKPMLKRMEEREVVFAIPKAVLEAQKTYQVEVRIGGEGAGLLFIWEFTTGAQAEGLKF